MTTPAGTSATSPADEFTYEATPVLSALSPVAGPLEGGSTVTVTGSGFNGTTGVSFGSTSASSFTIDSYGEITVVSPPEAAGTVDVRVTTLSGTSPVSSADEFTYEATPAIGNLSPKVGLPAGGTSVTISGTGFQGASTVDFGSSAAASYTVTSSTEISAVSPSAYPGTVDVSVTTPLGTSATSALDTFTYEAAPTVSALSPAVGPTTGSSTVTITGTGLTGATAVDFGTLAAASYTIVSGASITAISPAQAAGLVDVTVTTPIGTSALTQADQFTYEPAPVVTSLSPVAGALLGGTVVTISGSGLTGASSVKFGSVAAASYSVVSATSITATTPAQLAGTVDVTVTTPVATSAISSADQFTYEAPPSVSGVSPLVGPTAGGSTVTVTGANFIGASAVDFGTVVATSFTVISASSLSAVTAPGSLGTVDVTVTTPLGTSAVVGADHFTYAVLPSVISHQPVCRSAHG